MIVTATFVKENEDEDTIGYVEQQVGRTSILASRIRFSRESIPDPPPPTIQVTLEWPERATPSTTEARGPIAAQAPLSGPTPKPRHLRTGDRVTVVKNRDPGVKHPPEWLAQYVGRSGTVVRVTAHGAVIRLDRDATWFSYDELEVKS